MKEKQDALGKILKEMGSVAVAFSGGVDSTFLLKTAHDLLGDRAVAVTALASFVPRREQKEAEAFCEREGIRQVIVRVDASEIEGFSQNPPNRCYLCKKELFTRIREKAGELGISCVAEGSNVDDGKDYRPGMAALRELGIYSPLAAAGFGKEEIRECSRRLGLPTWEKPSFACLASRFVYGETITREKLGMVEKAEDWLLGKGFGQFRVRVHGNMARIEVLPGDIPRFADPALRGELTAYFDSLGFSYTSLDLKGYRTGAMNETLDL